jgi:hypothetical protein
LSFDFDFFFLLAFFFGAAGRGGQLWGSLLNWPEMANCRSRQAKGSREIDDEPKEETWGLSEGAMADMIADV